MRGDVHAHIPTRDHERTPRDERSLFARAGRYRRSRSRSIVKLFPFCHRSFVQDVALNRIPHEICARSFARFNFAPPLLALV